jgi:CDP-2,3-bis-(O-geranylgeranyl)-sn-glycerol synthase
MLYMLRDIGFAVWFLLPAACANAAPIFAAALPFLKKWTAPIDGGMRLRGRRLLGAHKTWRGIASGIVVATIVLWLQTWLVAHYGWAAGLGWAFDYASAPVWLLGPLMALGALGGDALKSFFKRQAGVPDGRPWPPFDQLDYILGSMLVTLPFAVFPAQIYFWMVGVWVLTHLFASYIGWLLGLKEGPI